MKITIEITNAEHILILSSCTSIDSFFEHIQEVLGECIAADPGDASLEITSYQLDRLQQPLSSLHQAVREQLMLRFCGKFVERIRNEDYTCVLEKGHPGPCQG